MAIIQFAHDFDPTTSVLELFWQHRSEFQRSLDSNRDEWARKWLRISWLGIGASECHKEINVRDLISVHGYHNSKIRTRTTFTALSAYQAIQASRLYCQNTPRCPSLASQHRCTRDLGNRSEHIYTYSDRPSSLVRSSLLYRYWCH